MRRSRKLVTSVIVIVAVVAVAVGYLLLRPSDPTRFAAGRRVDLAAYHEKDPTGVPASLAAADPIARGEYLTRAADCVSCHTAPGAKAYAGGRRFKLPFGNLYSPNITPDKETGIGDWSDNDFVRAMHAGIGRGGEHLYPAFPYTSYTLLTRGDVLAIKNYLFSLKPVRNAPPANDLQFPYNQRYLMFFWNLLFNPGHRFQPNIDQTAEWNRGAYLVEALGHCGDCHTPRNLLQGLKSSRKFAGATIEGWKAYNITPDPRTGIGAWSDDQLVRYLSSGHADGRGSAGGPMGEAVDNSLRFLVQDDVRAMSPYLRSVPPISEGIEVAANPGQPANSQASKTTGLGGGGDGVGWHVFAGACASCHNWDGRGVVSPYTSLIGSRSLNDPEAVNLTQVILHGSGLHTPHGPAFMPAFGKAYTDAEIAGLVTYVTGRFGAGTAPITPNDIAKRRQED